MSDRLVMCPDCRRAYRALVNRAWYRRAWQRWFGYPLLQCEPCSRAADLAARHGGEAADYHSEERAPT